MTVDTSMDIIMVTDMNLNSDTIIMDMDTIIMDTDTIMDTETIMDTDTIMDMGDMGMNMNMNTNTPRSITNMNINQAAIIQDQIIRPKISNPTQIQTSEIHSKMQMEMHCLEIKILPLIKMVQLTHSRQMKKWN